MFLNKLQDFITIALSIIVEATPFLVLGTLLATLAMRFNWFERLAPRLPENKFFRRLSIASMGFALPVCECGNVPLSRTLARRGFSVKESATFLLAAPILNPITIITTREAFRSIPWIMPARVMGGLLVALIVGEIVGRVRGGALTADFEKTCRHAHKTKLKDKKGLGSFGLKFAEEFWPMLKLLIIGAVIASLIQNLVNQNSFADLGQGILTGALFMLILGFVISICSSVDAFFALSYSGFVRSGALLTFLIAGPMVDIKTISMLRTTYRRRALIVMTASVAILSLVIGVALSYVK